MWKRVWKNVKNLINNFIWLHLEEIIYWLLLLLFSHLVVSDSFATPWIGITQARMLEWVAISFLQGIFLTQGSNPRLLHCRQILYHWATWETQHIGSFLSFNHYVVSDSFVVVHLPSHVWLFATPWTAAHQASLAFTLSWNLLKLTSTESSIPSNHLILCAPFSSYPQSFSSSGSFSINWLIPSGGQNIGASASVLPMNIQDWYPLGLTDLISLLSKGLSRVFSSTTVWKHQFFSAQYFSMVQFSYLYITTGKTISIGYTGLNKIDSYNYFHPFLFFL